ncbi:MAG TPA: hypothetical protein VMC09_06490 [Anaerolineales bacterium]|nr:hypothetical protein [Anaerolineales bacterium]
MDTQTGTWSIFIENDGLDFYSFSPTERRVIQGSGSNLYLHDLKTGDEQSISLNDYVDIGAVVWSPDGLAFAFAAQKSIDPISDPYDYKYSVFLYNIQNQKLKSIITDSLDRRVPQEWTADGILLIPLADYSNDPILGQTLYYNINTLSFVTATPIP